MHSIKTIFLGLMVCQLKKSLYGLKQASWQWFAKPTSALISAGDTQSRTDYSLFTLHTDNFITLVVIYVDDILVTGSNSAEITKLKLLLDTSFSIKDLGPVKYYLGFEFSRSSQGKFVHERNMFWIYLTSLIYLNPNLSPLLWNSISNFTTPLVLLFLMLLPIGVWLESCNTSPSLNQISASLWIN